MKFYKEIIGYYYFSKIVNNKLTSIYCGFYTIAFYKNGTEHNNKNYACIANINKNKYFYLNGKNYSSYRCFTKQLWRKFVKLQVFL
jgi:hypothetical protein